MSSTPKIIVFTSLLVVMPTLKFIVEPPYLIIVGKLWSYFYFNWRHSATSVVNHWQPRIPPTSKDYMLRDRLFQVEAVNYLVYGCLILFKAGRHAETRDNESLSTLNYNHILAFEIVALNCAA